MPPRRVTHRVTWRAQSRFLLDYRQSGHNVAGTPDRLREIVPRRIGDNDGLAVCERLD
jgi:hypothetical protein